MKHKLAFKAAVWWLALCMVLGIFLLVVSKKDPRESDEENRMLAGFPELSLKSVADASFMHGFDDFLSDAVIGRSYIKNFTSHVTGVFNTLSADEQMEVKAKTLEQQLANEGAAFDGGEAEEDTASASPEELIAYLENEPSMPENEKDEPQGAYLSPETETNISGKAAYLRLNKVDGGSTTLVSYPTDIISEYADNLKLVLKYLPEDGSIYFARSPVADMAHRWTTQPEVYCGWESTLETQLQAYTDSDRIHIFNVPAILEPHLADGEYIYYLTDHHWTALGAYYVARDILHYQGLPVISYDEYEYEYLRSAADKNGNTDVFEVLHPLLPARSFVISYKTRSKEIDLMNYKVNTYRSYMNNTRTPWRRVITGVNAGRKALVMTDSYGNVFTLFLLPYYDEVHMVDFRYSYWDRDKAGGSIGDLMLYHGIDDVYIIISTTNDVGKQNSNRYLRKYLTE